MRAAFEGDVRPAVIKRRSFYKNIHREALIAVRFGRGDFLFFSLPPLLTGRLVFSYV